MKNDRYSIDEEKRCSCGKGKTIYKNNYSEPENPLYDPSPAILISSEKISTTCPDNCDSI